MDNLDRISIWAIVILIISSFVLTAGYKGEAGPARTLKQRSAYAASSIGNAELDKKIRLAKNLMESNNLNKAEILVKELIRTYPYEGGPHMVMGDILMRRQQLIMAMPEYKEGTELNPDYLDKKTPLFQGKKLKIAVNEALSEVEKTLKVNPDDSAMKQNRKLIYYLQRRIAGSCG